MNSKIPALVFVGGFLGAGKTSLILRAAEMLQTQGKRVAVITNDQDQGLVDSKMARANELPTGEVAGGCFCCRFSDLLDAAGELAEYQPDVIFAEPVGSCIDLSATILQPLKAYHRDRYRLAPLTVLIDPALAGKLATPDADPDLLYLFQQQLAEADLLCFTKHDLYPDPPVLPVPVDFCLSAVSGEGVAEWLDEILSGNRLVGTKLLEVDYQRYAAAEAALGWVNLHGSMELQEALSAASFAGPLLDRLRNLLDSANIFVAHLKIFDETSSGYIKASLCGDERDPVPEGDLLGEPTHNHDFAVNLRAIAEPEVLERIVRQALAEVNGTVTIRHLGAFRPAPPKPEHRFAVTAS